MGQEIPKKKKKFNEVSEVALGASSFPCLVVLRCVTQYIEWRCQAKNGPEENKGSNMLDCT